MHRKCVLLAHPVYAGCLPFNPLEERTNRRKALFIPVQHGKAMVGELGLLTWATSLSEGATVPRLGVRKETSRYGNPPDQPWSSRRCA
jgi:hypothetical protein